MTEDSLVITYETLYEILRAEKNKEELCELDERFYHNLLIYLKEKTQILQEASAKSDIFSIDERDNTQVQLQNIRKIIKEIYERREKKIIGMALNKSRTNSDIIDTTNLLSSEQKFFSTLRGLFDKFRLGILAQILSLNEPNLNIDCSIEIPEPELTSSEEPPPETTPELSESVYQEIPKTEEPVVETIRSLAAESTLTETSKNTKKIKITQAIEQFVGSELEMYGPYNSEEIAEVPVEIAEILIEKGSAVEIE